MLVFVELVGAGERGCVRRVGGAQPGHWLPDRCGWRSRRRPVQPSRWRPPETDWWPGWT